MKRLSLALISIIMTGIASATLANNKIQLNYPKAGCMMCHYNTTPSNPHLVKNTNASKDKK